jgi:hypothetical protein
MSETEAILWCSLHGATVSWRAIQSDVVVSLPAGVRWIEVTGRTFLEACEEARRRFEAAIAESQS